MFVRTSTETPQKKLHIRVTFFPFLSERKIRKSTELEEERGKEGKEDAATKGPPGPNTPFPFTRRVLLVQDGSVPF